MLQKAFLRRNAFCIFIVYCLIKVFEIQVLAEIVILNSMLLLVSVKESSTEDSLIDFPNHIGNIHWNIFKRFQRSIEFLTVCSNDHDCGIDIFLIQEFYIECY